MSKLVVDFDERVIKEWGGFDEKREKIIDEITGGNKEYEIFVSDDESTKHEKCKVLEQIEVELESLLSDIFIAFDEKLISIIYNITKDKNLYLEDDSYSGDVGRVYSYEYELDSELTEETLVLLKQELTAEFGFVDCLGIEED